MSEEIVITNVVISRANVLVDTQKDRTKLKEQLAELMNCKPSDIKFTFAEQPKVAPLIKSEVIL